jgi:hypothetical protein
MTPAQREILSHPITIVMVTALIGSIGYLIGIIVGLISDNAKLTQATSEISEILRHVVTRQDKVDESLDEIKGNLSELLGEHKAMVRAGNLIASHAHQPK